MLHERLTALKEQTGLTHQQISDLSGVPLSTVKRIFSGATPEPSIISVNNIVKAMGGSLDDVMSDESAIIATDEGTCQEPRKTSQIENNKAYEHIIALYREMIESKNRWIRGLFIFSLAIVLFLIVLLLFDFITPYVGYIN